MQIHPQRLWVLFLLLCISINVKGQDSSATEVVLIGTKHTPHKGYNSDSLLKVVVNLKPDVILLEHDSVSGIFKTGQFKPIPRWIQYLSRITGWSKNDVEGNMIHKYYRVHPPVIIGPIDVALNGRERENYIKEFNQLEKKFYAAMTIAYENKEMTNYQNELHQRRDSLQSVLWYKIYSTLQEFNTDSTTEYTRQLISLQDNHFKALVDSIPSLQPFAERVYQNQSLWHLRDEVMAQQILCYINAFPGKRIVVITGFFHRYYQIDHLAPKQEEMNFRLLDIYGDEMTFRQIIPFNPVFAPMVYSYKKQAELSILPTRTSFYLKHVEKSLDKRMP